MNYAGHVAAYLVLYWNWPPAVTFCKYILGSDMPVSSGEELDCDLSTCSQESLDRGKVTKLSHRPGCLVLDHLQALQQVLITACPEGHKVNEL